MSSLTKKIVVTLSVIVFCYAAAGYVMGRSSNDKAFEALTVYSEVLGHIQHDYVDDPNVNSVTNGALHGLLDSLDPESSYLSASEYKDYKAKLSEKAKGEAGMALTKRFGYIGVLSVLPGSPAQKAGLHLGDLLEKVAGFSTSQMAVEQAQLLLSGEPGSTVAVSVIQPGSNPEPKEIQITLEKLAAPKLAEDKIQGDVAYLRVPEFSSGMTKQIREKLEQFNHQGARKLILDLRNCALGDDQEGISTAQLFLSSGTIATLKGQTVSPIVSSAEPSKVVWTQPVAVLIGNGTAGAAEIVAGAISGNHRGDTIGDRTYGTASMQKLLQLDDGSALILTVANYYTPSGREIQLEGVAAKDVVQPPPPDTYADMSQVYPPAPSSSPDDPVLKKALEVLQGVTTPAKKAA